MGSKVYLKNNYDEVKKQIDDLIAKKEDDVELIDACRFVSASDRDFRQQPYADKERLLVDMIKVCRSEDAAEIFYDFVQTESQNGAMSLDNTVDLINQINNEGIHKMDQIDYLGTMLGLDQYRYNVPQLYRSLFIDDKKLGDRAGIDKESFYKYVNTDQVLAPDVLVDLLSSSGVSAAAVFDKILYDYQKRLSQTKNDKCLEKSAYLKIRSATPQDVVDVVVDHCGQNLPSIDLDTAVALGNKKLFDAALPGADPNSAIIRAVNTGQSGMVHDLLAAGAKANCRHTYLLADAIDNGYSDIAAMLINHGANMERDGGKAVELAVRKLDADVLKIMIERGCNKGMITDMVKNWAGFIFQDEKDRVPEFVDALIASGITFDAKTADLAFGYGCFDVVSSILESGVSKDDFINLIHNRNEVITLSAAQMDFLDNLGIDNYSNEDFISACRYGQIEEVKRFVDKGFDVNAKVNGKTPLESICGFNDDHYDDINRAAIAIYLVNHGAKITDSFRESYPKTAKILQLMADDIKFLQVERDPMRSLCVDDRNADVLPPKVKKNEKENDILR